MDRSTLLSFSNSYHVFENCFHPEMSTSTIREQNAIDYHGCVLLLIRIPTDTNVVAENGQLIRSGIIEELGPGVRYDA